MQAFTWGDGGATVTPDALAERRKLARVLMAQGSDTSPVQHWTQGAARIAQSLLGTYDMGQADKAERGARDASSERSKALLGALVGGDAPQSSMASIPVSAEAPSPSGGGIGAGGIRSPGMANAFPRSLIQSESGGNWQAQNNVTGAGGMPGHFGRLQFGQARLQDAMNAGAIPQGTTPQMFMADPGLQQQAEAWHFSDIDQNIKNSGLDRAIGATIKGIPVTQDGMRAVAHLGGSGGLAKFIQTGGQYDPADANGTRLSDYLKAHAGQTASPQAQPVQMAQAQQPNASQIQGLMQIINDPWAKPGDKTAAQFLLQKRLTAETKDPVRSALEQEQLTAARNQNAQAPLARQEKQLSIQKSQRELDGTMPRAPNVEIIRDAATGEIIAVDKNNVDGGVKKLREGGPSKDAPVTRQIKQPDGSEVVVQWNAQTRTWDPMSAPQGGAAIKAPAKLTEQQSKDLVYYNRGIQSLEALGDGSALTELSGATLGQVPIAGNYAKSDQYRQAEQSGRNFLLSILRKDTGAAVTKSEEQIYGDVFLPKPGDDPKTLSLKADARRQAIDGIRDGLGAADVLALGQRLTRKEDARVPTPDKAAPKRDPAKDPLGLFQ